MLVDEEYKGFRLDVYLADVIPAQSRSYYQNLISRGHVTVNGAKVKQNYRLDSGDRVDVFIPPPRETEIEAEDLKIDIVYEDNDIVVVNKAQGMVVHPAPGNYSGTLVNGLLYHVTELSGINGEIRPGIVHRIDKDTSGLLVVAKNDAAHRNLAAQIKNRTACRAYLALVENNIKADSGTVDAPIGRHPADRKRMTVISNGREAVTNFTVLERFGQYTFIEARLKTGRTHQIRVHMAHMGHPVLGDPVYGSKKQKFSLAGQALHAYKLGINHPASGEYMEFTAPLPEYFEKLLKNLRAAAKN